MNYRHGYHAGNFADVLKHLVLALVIEHLKLKPAPFRVIDTHAGAGRYSLQSVKAQKTGEWQGGIGRIFGADLSPGIAELMAPYLSVVAAENAGLGELENYPGSPLVARHLMRRGDVLAVNELHPEDHERLAALFTRDPQVKVLNIDGWQALKALLPPKERRGVILIDPPFEEPGELSRMVQGLNDMLRRFATGTAILWYPVKDNRAIAAFQTALAEIPNTEILCADLFVRTPDEAGPLAGTGVAVLNPPFTLSAKLERLLPFFVDVLGAGPGAHYRLGTAGQAHL
jgi:23S rRNA (adenine2030-N6)-methyltransferase